MERVTRHRAVERSDVERSNPQDAERMRYSEGQAATARATCTIPSGHATPYDGERQRVDAGPDSRRMTSKYRTGNDGRRADDSGRSLPQAPIGRQIRSTPQLDFARNQKSANISKGSGTKTELSHLFVCEAFASWLFDLGFYHVEKIDKSVFSRLGPFPVGFLGFCAANSLRGCTSFAMHVP